MSSFIIGILVGMGVVGSSIGRTLAVSDKNNVAIVVTSIINGISYYISVKYIADNNILGYVGTCVGSIIICFMLIKRRKSHGHN